MSGMLAVFGLTLRPAATGEPDADEATGEPWAAAGDDAATGEADDATGEADDATGDVLAAGALVAAPLDDEVADVDDDAPEPVEGVDEEPHADSSIVPASSAVGIKSRRRLRRAGVRGVVMSTGLQGSRVVSAADTARA
jgi:hypothetical protein